MLEMVNVTWEEKIPRCQWWGSSLLRTGVHEDKSHLPARDCKVKSKALLCLGENPPHPCTLYGASAEPGARMEECGAESQRDRFGLVTYCRPPHEASPCSGHREDTDWLFPLQLIPALVTEII